jgi:hypothetical protein
MAKEHIHEDDADEDEARIGTYLHLAEILLHKLGNGQRQAFTGQA